MSVDAPERIWLSRQPDYWESGIGTVFTFENGSHNMEYVCADKLEDLQRKNDELAAEYERLKDLNDKYIWQVRDTCRRAEKAEAALAEKDKEIAALRELVDSAESIFINCSVTDGMCCCGDNMENHHSPMSCGHTPVDHGAYQVDLWIKARNAGGTDG